MDAGKKTINEIFNGSRILEIPFFKEPMFGMSLNGNVC